ncbi:hypothetical protein JX266_005478 [Neoarthrinium moseri]|uniref:uncharacterized protein n=1 Tax=Neoarthrinium moseri TaxID=1658444 RepID=UPI001FDBF0FE|nr:uncharacterized protein JN550_011723 [Neoarthrinium moseri]KAI1848619.1 hypothetical protein JX266_005478 [Neoarthrinium moseri]KAI1860039.1 hypothetical protein JN550_011723 [Neoarthrinium moseri]
MAAVTRQPFAPLDGARLQTLTSLKNRQNAITTASPVKRKASDIVDADDSENVNPVLFSKRSKGADGFSLPKDFIKPASFVLTKSASTSNIASPPKAVTPRPRSLLHPKSPAAKLNTGIAKSSPLSAPAGRSPTRGKRTGLLSSRRRTAGSYGRIDPPVFGLGASSSSSPAPFSLDAALKGTIPSYVNRTGSSSTRSTGLGDLLDAPASSSWDFDIHEDTAEQEMTNLLQHSTCVLDISSDEESESRRERELAEGKENVPPMDDVSQTSRPRAARAAADLDDMIIEKQRNPLGEMNVRDYYAEGCDESSIVVIPGDEDEEPQPAANEFQFAPELKTADSAETKVPTPELASEPASEPQPDDGAKTVDELMQKTEEPAPGAALLQPIDGTGDSFEVWESGSAKDETEVAVDC